jgi:nucleoid-associated protein YgaU
MRTAVRYSVERMYAAGYGIKPWRAPRAGGFRSVRRLLAAVAAVFLIGIGFALGARGGGEPGFTTVVVQPGDTLWSIAAVHYPDDDVRLRIQDIEAANGLDGPIIAVGQTLRLPG